MPSRSAQHGVKGGKGFAVSFPGILPNWQAPAKAPLGLKEHSEATPAAKAQKHCPEMQTHGQAVFRPKCCLRMKTPQADRALGLHGCGGSSQARQCRGALCTSRDEKHYSSLEVMLPIQQYFFFSDICLCQSNFCVTCGMSLFHTAISTTLL